MAFPSCALKPIVFAGVAPFPGSFRIDFQPSRCIFLAGVDDEWTGFEGSSFGVNEDKRERGEEQTAYLFVVTSAAKMNGSEGTREWSGTRQHDAHSVGMATILSGLLPFIGSHA